MDKIENVKDKIQKVKDKIENFWDKIQSFLNKFNFLQNFPQLTSFSSPCSPSCIPLVHLEPFSSMHSDKYSRSHKSCE